ncbi:MAG: hypothetical protein WB946_07805 [Halobacteriota archaeon]
MSEELLCERCGHDEERHAVQGWCWGTRDAEAARVFGEDCNCPAFVPPVKKEGRT